jgi:outer membrane protein TolC
VQAFGTGKIPLEKAVEQGIRLDAGWKNLRLEGRKAAVELEKARKTKWFTLDLGGSYLFKSEQIELRFPDTQPAPGVIIPGTHITAGSKHNYDLRLSLVQPVYTGNIISNSIAAAEQKAAVERYNLQQRKIEVAGAVKSSYFSFRLMKSKKRSLTLLIRNLELHRTRIADLYKEDLARKSDLLETEIKITEARMNLEALNRRMEEENIRFARLCSYDIADIREDYVESAGSFEESLARFTQHHPALKTLDRRVRLLQIGEKVVSGKYLPQVSGFAEVHYGRPGIDFFADRWSLYFQGGISVRMTLFDWNRLKREHELANASIRQLTNRREELVTEVKKGLKQLYAGLRSLGRQLELAKKLAASAAEDAALKEALYKENQAANVDYLSALVNKERYESLQDELGFQTQLLKMNINILVGKEEQ